MSVDYLPFSMEVAPTSVLTFYNGKMPIEEYAQRMAGFACFLGISQATARRRIGDIV
jgi:hypothetical protein